VGRGDAVDLGFQQGAEHDKFGKLTPNFDRNQTGR
jgi:hypothetical protein